MDQFRGAYQQGLLAEPMDMASFDPYGAAATGVMFAPGSGVADVLGYAPDPMAQGQNLPSMMENIRGGQYADAAGQGLGLLGDAFMAAGTVVPPLLPVGAAMKAPRAAKVASKAADIADLRRQANIERFGYDPNETPSGLLAEPDVSYRMQHQPRGPEDDLPVRLDDLTKSTTGEQAGFPDDFYTPEGRRTFAPGPRFDNDEFGVAGQQSYRAILAAKGNPDAEVTIYRGVPDDPNITTINRGDFVTLSPKYAELHAASGYGRNGDEPGKVLSEKVKVKDIYWDGNDVNEFGYFPDKKMAGIRAYHGSPYDFERFDVSKIGTGEGAQAYGRGLYFAENPKTARDYRDQLTQPPFEYKIGGKSVPKMYEDAINNEDYELAEVLEQVQLHDTPTDLKSRFTVGEGYSQETEDFVKSLDYDNLKGFDEEGAEVPLGRQYEVNIAADPENFLNYQDTIANMPDQVRARLYKNPEIKEFLDKRKEDGMRPEFYTGGKFYDEFSDYVGGENVASDILNEAGIPGIKYLDLGSRTGAKSLADATSNYVVFDDKLVEIMRKYGLLAPLVGAGTVAAVSDMGEDRGLLEM